ncbi:MAG: L-asparaginase II [Bacteroidetes bacterium B1(2017)]|nr:MAG: L-asparaginase II [Bacteroidetes bacterium B1(2017)]
MENPILVEIYRGGVLESFHRGSVCVVNQIGEIVFSLGNPNQICYPRSAMKFVQAIPLIELGGVEKFGFTLEEIAIFCGSHNGEAKHLEVVRSILNKIEVSEEELGCGSQYPTNKKDSDELVRTNTKPSAIHNNCSGKHAGMLALCKLLNYPTADYLNPKHPIQELILECVEAMYEYPKSKMVCALDGCTAPIYSIPVYNQALCFKNLAEPSAFSEPRQTACKTILEAISAHPFMVAGSKRYCTDMMNLTAPKLIGKTGAEGVFCMSFTEQKLGVCIKIDDGKMLPQYNVAQALLEASGLFGEDIIEKLHSYATSELKNFNKLVTGEITVNTNLFAPFSKVFE